MLSGRGGGRRCAVLGSPIGHSRSPQLHRAAYRALGLSWTYEAVELTADRLPAFVDRLGPEWVGLSLTMPLKAAALAVAADVGPVAAATGVANTLVRHGGGWYAENTDAVGLRRALDEAGVHAVATACVLGSGATARSSVWALADRCPRVTVVARSPAPGLGAEVRPLGDPVARADGLSAELVVSTTPAGALDALADEVPAVPGAYVDWVYAPWPTPLARAYGRAGRTLVGGPTLLLHQAVLQVELMTGQAAPVAAMRAALARELPVDDGGR